VAGLERQEVQPDRRRSGQQSGIITKVLSALSVEMTLLSGLFTNLE
jgi:hypothetical protein